MSQISILIPNRFSWDGVILTIESILSRTQHTDYKIVVCDNSQAPWNPKVEPPRQLDGIDDNGNRLKYLRTQQGNKNLELIEVTEQYKKYGHGENIKRLLSKCETPYAMLLSSGTEIISSHWLVLLMAMLRNNAMGIGVAKSTEASQHFNSCWASPKFIPNWMLLDMKKYQEIASDDDWSLKRVSIADYPYPELFAGLPELTDERDMPPRVFLDTGWRLYEKLVYGKYKEENPRGYEMITMPDQFVKNEERQTNMTQLLFFGGLDRNAYRPHHEYVEKRKKEIRKRLQLLRKKNA